MYNLFTCSNAQASHDIYIYVIEHTRYIWHSIVYQNNIVQCKHYVLQKDKGKLD